MHQDANDIEFHHELVSRAMMEDMYTKLVRVIYIPLDDFAPQTHVDRSFVYIGLSSINPVDVSRRPFLSLCISTTSSSCRCCKLTNARPKSLRLLPICSDRRSLFRYIRLVVSVFAFYSLRPIRIPGNPRFFSKDVTVIIPSLEGDSPELFDTVQSILATEPYEIILVTVDAQLARAQLMIKRMGTFRARVMSVPHPNKRWQMVRAIPDVRTGITIFADDDVTWPSTLLPWILAPFDDERYGGVGTNQRLRRANAPSIPQRAYGYLGALYLERRNFDCASCMYMDGGLPCLSGRTVAYRTKILKDHSFIHEFTHEQWTSKYQLHADDDNFLTRWMCSHGWKIWYQYHKEAEILTTLEDNTKFWRQCLRWVRSNWRSNLTSLFREEIWRLVDS